MFQRIQTVLLFISAIALGVFLLTNTWTSTNGTSQVLANPYQIIKVDSGLMTGQQDVFYIAVLAGLALILSIFNTFQYKNRVRQMLFVALNSLLIGAAVAVSIYHIKYDAMTLASNEGTFDIGLYAGFTALASNWLANRFIKKDEKLVKSADRMR